MRTIVENKKTIAVSVVLLMGVFVWTLTAGDFESAGDADRNHAP